MPISATYVFPSGDPSTAKYIVVGGFPDKASVISGKPFSGPDGIELKNCLHSANIAISDCYLTYIIKDVDHPRGQYIRETKKGPIISKYGQEYIKVLAKELSKCSAKIIITLGNIPLFVLTDRLSSFKWRGSVIDATLLSNKKVLSALDPNLAIPHIDYTTHKYLKGQYKYRRLLIFDFIRARKVQEGTWNPKDRSISIRPSFSFIKNFLRTCKHYGLLGNPISYDIEVDVFNGEMTCISFAYSPTDVISIPFTCERGDYFTIPQEAEVLLDIAEILENPDIPICGQNLCFDSHYMLRKYGIHVTNMHDTMVAQKILMPDYYVGLHFICSLYTDLPYYKDDGKYWLKGIGNFEIGWKYNALDSVVCADANPKQITALIKQGNYYTYLRKCKTIPPLVYIMEKGIRINLGSMTQAYNEMGKEAEAVLAKLHEACGFPLNPASPKQVADYFYDTKRLPVYKSKTGGRSTDEKALKRIARKGHKEAKLILTYRSLIKEQSTFLNPEKIDSDGRIRCSYNPVGTRFSRISSSGNIFGTGNNLQNQPHRVLHHFLADPNYVHYSLDLSQAENRIVAYEGKITQMIEAFERGDDIHGLTAKIMMRIFYGNEKADKMSIKALAPIGDGKKTWRDWGKKANHGLNYDLGFKTFSLYNEIPERDGKTIVNIYHRAYPGVRGGFHAYVKQCINKNRTLTNLMGRKTVFQDKLDDALYKDAYACIPQGTVGDLIDQRGMNFIYYSKDPLIQRVELMIQVHDSIGFQLPTPYHPTRPLSWKDHAYILDQIKRSLETPIYTHYKCKFVIPADIMMGVTLCKDEGVEFKTFTPESLENSYYEVTKKWLPLKLNSLN